jgi:hypothetical protein
MLMRKKKKALNEAIECRTFLVTQKINFLSYVLSRLFLLLSDFDLHYQILKGL